MAELFKIEESKSLRLNWFDVRRSPHGKSSDSDLLSELP